MFYFLLLLNVLHFVGYVVIGGKLRDSSSRMPYFKSVYTKSINSVVCDYAA